MSEAARLSSQPTRGQVEPLQVHCKACAHEWQAGELPMLVDAFVATLNLRAAVIAYRNAVVPSAQTRSRYTVPRTMAVWEIALAVYGDASQVQTILSANTFTDATAIRAGTVVSVLPID